MIRDAAEKAEFKGQRAKAFGRYQELLYQLRTDDIADEDQLEIAAVEQRINGLETPPRPARSRARSPALERMVEVRPMEAAQPAQRFFAIAAGTV